MIDVNKPVTNPELVESINNFLKEPNEKNECIMIDKILSAHYLVPIILDGEIKDGVLKKGSIIAFKTITNTSNETFFPAFTDWDELFKWSKNNEQTLISTYEDLKAMLMSSDGIMGFVINPYSQNIVITPDIMEYMSRKNN